MFEDKDKRDEETNDTEATVPEAPADAAAEDPLHLRDEDAVVRHRHARRLRSAQAVAHLPAV